ncbi:hypothetical protein EMIT0P44_80189 [Pseudomonas sp. IT-P44]
MVANGFVLFLLLLSERHNLTLSSGFCKMAAILPEGSWIRPTNHDPYHRGAQWRVPRQALVG